MPIATNSRTRFKKLSYKAPVIVHRGNLQQSAQQVEVEGLDEHDAPNLGVDLSEEHHLQAALSSTQLVAEGDKSISAKPAYHIPTPDAKQILDSKVYAELYRPGSYQDPVTYVRSSATVEDAIKGPTYNLDEDDQEWLEARNEKAREAAAAALKDMKPALLAKLGGGGANGKGKGKEQTPAQLAAALGEENPDYRIITEDEMEMVLAVFEQVTSDTVPFAHLDKTQLPSQEEMLQAFEPESSVSKLALPELPQLSWGKEASTSAKGLKKQQLQQQQHSQPQYAPWSPSNPWHNLSALKPLASVLFPWWSERRDERQGKVIIPQLNFDESNDSDPYVCFRRREVKLTRKTRKTDVLHLEKLLKLRAEMNNAVEILQNIAQREGTKRASLGQDRILWETVKDLQEVKRLWGIVGPAAGQEDEDLISGEKREEAGYGVGAAPRKKRRTEEAAAAAAAAASAATSAAASVASANSKGLKRTRQSVEPGSTAAAGGTPAATQSLGQAIMERAQAVQAYIERECLRRADTDVGWEEGSDAAYQPVPAPANIRNFRPIQSDTADVPPFASAPTLRSGRPPSFRRRLARGGRVFLDRRMLAPSPVPANLAEWPSRRDAPSLVNLRRSANNAVASSIQSSGMVNKADQTQQAEVLTGPFAFASDLRPSLLNTLTPSALDDRGRSFVPIPTSHSPHSDTASDSSQSTDQSKDSAVSSAIASTVLTDVDEAEDDLSRSRGQKGSHKYVLSSEDESSDDEEDEIFAQERRRMQQERWRYDDESGHWAGLGLYGLGGMEDDDEAVLDDFDQRFQKYRMTLLEEEDFLKLSTDWSHVMQAQMAIDCPPPAPNVSVVGPTAAQAQQQHAAATAAAAAAQEARRGNTEPNAPKSGASGNGSRPNTAPNAQAVQAAQLQAAQQHALLRQQQAAAIAAATAAGMGSLASGASMLPPNVPSSMTSLQPTSSAAVVARAAQTNVGGPLSALQQQQQIHQAQVQLAFQQHQQQQQRQGVATAQAHAQAQGRSSPNLAQQQQQVSSASRGRQLSSSSGGQQPHIHPLSQNFANGAHTSSPSMGSSNGATRFAAVTGFNGASTASAAASSPQLQSAMVNASPASVSSPLMQHQGQFQPQAQQGGVGQGQQMRLPAQSSFQQQQPQLPQQPFNNAAMQHANSLAQLQQQLAAMQAAQSAAGGGGGVNGVPGVTGLNGPSAAQLMAMKAALMNSQGQNLQLKLPANRALQINGGGVNGGNGGIHGGAAVGPQGSPSGPV